MKPRCALLAVAAAAGCARTPPPLVPPKPPEVVVERPVVRDITDYEDFTGHTEAFKAVEVRAVVSGYLRAVHFEEGQTVNQGDPLFEIDPRVFEAQLNSAKAAVKKADAELLLAEANLQRAEESYRKGVVGKEEFDRARAGRDAAQATIESAEAARQLADTNLAYTKIAAEYTGRIGQRLVDPGNLVTEKTTLLTTLVVVNPIYAAFEIDERTLLRIRKLIAAGRIPSRRDAELRVKVGLADEDGYSFDAALTFAANALEPTTGTLRLRATMENPNIQLGALPAVVGAAAALESQQKGLKLLSPGMFIRIRLPVGRPHPAVLIPDEAVGSDQGRRFVFVVNDKDVVEQRPVETGPQDGRLRVIETGLKAGERVITNGLQRVRPGVKVTPREPTAGKLAAKT